MLPVQAASSEAKDEANRLFSLMCYIISKVGTVGHFRENFIFANSIKRHISDV